MKKILIILFAVMTSWTITSQITSGALTLEVTDAKMNVEGMEQMGDMMKGMSMTMFFTPEKQVTNIVMNMMGMSMTIRQFHEGGKMTQFMDMMGQKMKMVIDMETAEQSVDMEAFKDAYTIEYDKSDTKVILGHNCYRANITMDLEAFGQDRELTSEVKDMSMVAYVTEDIKLYQLSLQHFKGLEMAGTPLLMTMDMGMMSMTYEATSFDKNVDKSQFEYPTGEYQEMSLEQIQQMGGAGFGF